MGARQPTRRPGRTWRVGRRGDEGQSLLEVVMALGVLSIVLLPLASVFYWGATNSAYNREYGDAIAIANGFLAKANAISYANLGFYENQFGTPPQTVPGYNGQPGVDLGATPTAPATAQVPTGTQFKQVGTVVFSEVTHIVWVDGSGGNAYAYKQVYAVVSWSEGGHNVSATQNILVYPGGLGKYTGPQDTPPSGTTGAPDNVAGLSACPGGPADVSPCVPVDPAGEVTVNLVWTAPVDPTGFYDVVWAPDPGGQLALVTPDTSGTSGAWELPGSTASGSIAGTATSFTVTGLAPSTKYWFEVVGFSSDGTMWATSQTWVSATTLTPPVQSCVLNTLTVSQPGQLSGQATVKKTNFHLTSAMSLTVTYSGSCTSGADTVTVAATSNGADPGSPYTLTWGSTQYADTVCPAAGFTTGTHLYTVSLNGSPTSLWAQVSFATTNGSAAC
ncbi:MAG TPA: fibronectin type III domain-containing protein [Acidimicrobiales bacterium]|nr:fibronectin type III domain-containing protein [Acidimicrobiales bacterium]